MALILNLGSNMIPVLFTMVACVSEPYPELDGGSMNELFVCDAEAGVAADVTSPELDPLLALYEDAQAQLWSATLDCDDGTTREVSLSYIASPRDEIVVSDRVTIGAANLCDLATAETDVEIDGSALRYSGPVDTRFGAEGNAEFFFRHASVDGTLTFGFRSDDSPTAFLDASGPVCAIAEMSATTEQEDAP